MTRRQGNNQWSGGIAAHTAPNSSKCKNPLEKFSSRFFGIKTAYSSLIIFQMTKLSTGSIISAGAIEGHFEGKTPQDNAPVHHRALATQKKTTCLGFQCLDHPPYSPDLALSDYNLFPGLKNN